MRLPRRQMRPLAGPWKGGRISAVAGLMGFHAALLLSQWAVEIISQDRVWDPNWLSVALGLDGAAVSAGQFWRFGTFFLVQPSPLFAMLALVALYLVGREIEPVIGRRHFLAVYIFGNLFGGWIHWCLLPATALVGNAAGLAALTLALGTVMPELQTTLRLPGGRLRALRVAILPAALVTICAALAVSGQFLERGPVAALAGALAGWSYARHLGFGRPFFFQRIAQERREREARLAAMEPAEFIQAEVDPLLEKISRTGLASLTRAERRLLEQAREKLSSRRGPGAA